MISTFKIYESQSRKEELKELLSMCSDEQIMKFKRMYSHDNLNRDINDIIEHNMLYKQIKHALFQVKNTLDNKAKKYNI